VLFTAQWPDFVCISAHCKHLMILMMMMMFIFICHIEWNVLWFCFKVEHVAVWWMSACCWFWAWVVGSGDGKALEPNAIPEHGTLHWSVLTSASS